MVKATGEESTSCVAVSVGQGCVWEAKLAIWPGLKVQEVEYLFLPEVGGVELGWLDWVAQGERAEEGEVLESRWKRRVEVQ